MWNPKDDVNGEYITYEELEARMEYCEQQAAATEISPFSGEPVPSEWSAQYAARALWLDSQYYSSGNWEDWMAESKVPGKVYVNERDYHPYIESLCEDYAYQDVYENGLSSMYSWMVWALHHEVCDTQDAIIEYADELELPCPEWMDKEYWDDYHEE